MPIWGVTLHMSIQSLNYPFFILRVIAMQAYKKYICVICGFIYDEAEGWPEDGIEPGTKWDDVPENWFCPDCGAGKEDFDMVEMD